MDPGPNHANSAPRRQKYPLGDAFAFRTPKSHAWDATSITGINDNTAWGSQLNLRGRPYGGVCGHDRGIPIGMGLPAPRAWATTSSPWARHPPHGVNCISFPVSVPKCVNCVFGTRSNQNFSPFCFYLDFLNVFLTSIGLNGVWLCHEAPWCRHFL